ncbi:MAG: N-acetyltransferase [Frankiaceae bacterium]|nr:N-acetyltransferase [Frankiaceae bacterium]
MGRHCHAGRVLTPFTLTGSVVVLEPLTAAHVPALTEAAIRDRSTYGFTKVPLDAADTAAYVTSALADRAGGRAVPFAVRRRSDDRIVGSTRYLDMDVLTAAPLWPPGAPGAEPADDLPPTVLEVGNTWYAADAQRTAVNTECKLLLLRHAFEDWGVRRVTLKTDARNERSRRAIERIGAAFEGIRRVHTVATDGALRDTAYYSIVSAEWPAVAERLAARLA